MKTIQSTLQHILNHPVIPVYYDADVNNCISVIQACYHGGIRVFEFTNRGSKAYENFKALIDYRNKNLPELHLGIGTIKTRKQAEEYIQLGADFIVSPIVNPEIAEVTLQKDILWIPGCMTPTEIHSAESAGAPLVKLFPGNILGPDFLSSIKPLFPSLLFMPTGGVNPEKGNIENWFSKGAIAVGLGSKLFQAPAEGDTESSFETYEWLTDRCKKITQG